jgi:hypothetical protein
MVEIQVDDMRGRGKPGYVAEIVTGEKVFLNAKSQNCYGASRVTKTYEINKDGIYEVCDANFGGRKRNIYFIKVENGEIIEKTYNLIDLIINKELPELEGSDRQISWAISIRENYLLHLTKVNKPHPDWVNTQTSAKWWIDNRDKFKTQEKRGFY